MSTSMDRRPHQHGQMSTCMDRRSRLLGLVPVSASWSSCFCLHLMDQRRATVSVLDGHNGPVTPVVFWTFRSGWSLCDDSRTVTDRKWDSPTVALVTLTSSWLRFVSVLPSPCWTCAGAMLAWGRCRFAKAYKHSGGHSAGPPGCGVVSTVTCAVLPQLLSWSHACEQDSSCFAFGPFGAASSWSGAASPRESAGALPWRRWCEVRQRSRL